MICPACGQKMKWVEKHPYEGFVCFNCGHRECDDDG